MGTRWGGGRLCLLGALLLGGSGCKASLGTESDAQRFSALRNDGGTSYLWQGSLLIDGAPGVELHENMVYQCWYRYDAPLGHQFADFGADSFAAMLQVVGEVNNLNVLAVPSHLIEDNLYEFEPLWLSEQEDDPRRGQGTGEAAAFGRLQSRSSKSFLLWL